MAIVYLEELVKHVPNKYLAVNVIAKRARSLNDELLGAGLSKKQKPVSIATDELSSGQLSYEIVDSGTSESEVKSLFSSESEGYNAIEGEDHLEELYGEKAPDKDVVESEEDTEESEDESEEAS